MNVTVRIEHTKWGSISGENGTYEIKNIKPGTWQLKVSAITAAAQERTVTVTAGQRLQVDFTLNENASRLHEIIVATRNGSKVTRTVAKIPLSNLENPQVYNTVSAGIMKQQGITNFDDALRNMQVLPVHGNQPAVPEMEVPISH